MYHNNNTIIQPGVEEDTKQTQGKNKIAVEKKEQLARHGYHTVRLLGQGAFSQVLLVKKKETDMLFACKVSDRQDLAHWEGSLLAAMDHPLFPRFRDLWDEGESTFLLMEYVSGSSLEELLRRRGALSRAQTARIGMELAEGLRFLHQLPDPILYRDVKPANIMIRQDGRVKLLDMGCACNLRQPDGARAGTPGYAAPEQLEEGGILSFASDVYGLGRTLEVIAGKNCAGKLGRVINACTAEKPQQRIPDMQGVMTALIPLCKNGRNGEGIPHQGFLQPRVTCVKSVWESEYKNT
ncbi:MAG: serine/threonine protein kinase [Acetatifactor sp.]|nr:serine/threonine protein kinase [Acetatifactor sp.]